MPIYNNYKLLALCLNTFSNLDFGMCTGRLFHSRATVTCMELSVVLWWRQTAATNACMC